MIKKLAGGAVAAVAVAFATAYAVSPVIAANGLVKAAQAGDAAALSRHVDFPAFRESLKAELGARLTAEIRRETGVDSAVISGLGALLGPSLISGAVDAFVTPEAIGAMVRTARAPRPDDRASAPTPGETAEAERDIHQSWGYRGLNLFAVTLTDRDAPDRSLALLMERRGLFDWKLTGVDLSDDDAR